MTETRAVAVIIPYYQTEPGILARALRGVLAQQLPADLSLKVHIVDDASPHPAGAELAAHPELADLDLVLTEQANAGPGSARNTALDLALASDQTRFVAFLDSDDIWRPDHIADAVAALDQGYDFYSCDNARPGTYDLFSEHIPLLTDGGSGLADRSVVVDPDGPVRGFAPRELSDDAATSYLSHTSTVVLRADAVRRIRFDPDLRNAGEDRMFWLNVALSDARIALSWRVNVDCGRGVNLFFSAYDWNSNSTLDRFGSELLFAEKLMRQSALSEKKKEFAQSRAARSRRAYSFLFIRMLVRLQRPSLRMFRQLLRFDPFLPFRMPPLFLSVFLDRRPAGERL
ncbi:glycosyltransferase [Rhodobacterales bacterium HKCCE3408]|nr:glycosyltransferase [Rhodobacterales bacterium HKCCE3408]